MITISGPKSWDRDTLEKVLHSIFVTSDIGWLQRTLSKYSVKNRTKIYKAFQFEFFYDPEWYRTTGDISPKQENERLEWVHQICEDRDLAIEILRSWLMSSSAYRIDSILKYSKVSVSVEIVTT